MRLVRSSVPGAPERDQAIGLLTERAVLTRMVCRELLDSDIGQSNRRPQAALLHLLRWIDENFAESVRVEPQADDGIDQMAVPEGFRDLVSEIVAGAEVCKAFFMLLTADSKLQSDQDQARIRQRLASYWERHPVPAAVIRTFD